MAETKSGNLDVNNVFNTIYSPGHTRLYTFHTDASILLNTFSWSCSRENEKTKQTKWSFSGATDWTGTFGNGLMIKMEVYVKDDNTDGDTGYNYLGTIDNVVIGKSGRGGSTSFSASNMNIDLGKNKVRLRFKELCNSHIAIGTNCSSGTLQDDGWSYHWFGPVTLDIPSYNPYTAPSISYNNLTNKNNNDNGKQIGRIGVTEFTANYTILKQTNNIRYAYIDVGPYEWDGKSATDGKNYGEVTASQITTNGTDKNGADHKFKVAGDNAKNGATYYSSLSVSDQVYNEKNEWVSGGHQRAGNFTIRTYQEPTLNNSVTRL